MAYSILIVDDSRTIRTMVRKTIELCGLALGQVHEAENGAAALAVLRDNWIDIVLTDIHMPGVDGLEMVEHMSRDRLLASIPVIVISSDHNSLRIEHLKALGVRAYLNKPFRPETLRDVVQQALGGQGGPTP